MLKNASILGALVICLLSAGCSGGRVFADAEVGIASGGHGAPYEGQRPGGAGRGTVEMTAHEHPFGTPGEYRCFANGQRSGGPGTGTGWCRNPS